MYDPMNPPAGGIPADPLPDDLPEGEAEEVDDTDLDEPIFDPYAGTVDPVDPEQLTALERGLADANAGRIVSRPLRSDEMREDDDDTQA
jgi:hypothetical protein